MDKLRELVLDTVGAATAIAVLIFAAWGALHFLAWLAGN